MRPCNPEVLLTWASSTSPGPRLLLVPEYSPGLFLQTRSRDHSWRSGRQVTVRSQAVPADPPQFFHLAAQVAAGRLSRVGKESHT